MREKSCVYKFIDRSQKSFVAGYSINEVRETIPHYQDLVKRAYGPIRNPLHKVFTSSIGLNALASYEYARHKGLPLPDSNNVIQGIWPVKRNCRLALFGGENIFDTRSETIIFDSHELSQN